MKRLRRTSQINYEYRLAGVEAPVAPVLPQAEESSVGDGPQLLPAGEGDPALRQGTQALRSHGHVRVRFPHGEHGQAPLRDV